MSKKRFGSVQECSDFVRTLSPKSDDRIMPFWTLSEEAIKKNQAIDENIRLLDVNVARIAAAHT